MRYLQIIHTNAGNVTVGIGERHSDGDDNDAGYETSLLLMNNKGIHYEGLLLDLD